MKKGDGIAPSRTPEHRLVLHYVFPNNGTGSREELGRAYSNEELAEVLANLVREGNAIEDLLVYSQNCELIAGVSVTVRLTLPSGETFLGRTD